MTEEATPDKDKTLAHLFEQFLRDAPRVRQAMGLFARGSAVLAAACRPRTSTVRGKVGSHDE